MRAFTPKQDQSKEQYRPGWVGLHGKHSPALHQHPIWDLQQTIGNQGMLATSRAHSEKPNAGLSDTASPHVGFDFSPIAIHPLAAGLVQRKLAINKPGDDMSRKPTASPNK